MPVPLQQDVARALMHQLGSGSNPGGSHPAAFLDAGDDAHGPESFGEAFAGVHRGAGCIAVASQVVCLLAFAGMPSKRPRLTLLMVIGLCSRGA